MKQFMQQIKLTVGIIAITGSIFGLSSCANNNISAANSINYEEAGDALHSNASSNEIPNIDAMPEIGNPASNH